MLSFRAATRADLPRAAALSALVGWNQVEADWSVFLDHGEVRLLEDAAEGLAASAALLPYGADLAWISMVLVRPDQRRRGFASALLRWAMQARPGIGCLALDATPAGRQVYGLLGFADVFGFARWSLPEALPPQPIPVRSMTEADWPMVLAMDAMAFGAPRQALLRNFAGRAPALVAEGGFVLARDGLRSPQIGPAVARDEATAIALVAAARSALGRPAVLDVPDAATGLTALMAAHGGTPQRPFTRMALGAMPPVQPAQNFVLAGPEFG
ncbi:GNAT family N-acetyltransferase [Falsiroseomonas sp. E2-1-a20]|uniref:GNAT family N-acetyltransferase n=1 Tax=Falsiroseomonas sp. E2-1-a20 TaxID=3239300 RepID=UPI003F2BDCE4